MTTNQNPAGNYDGQHRQADQRQGQQVDPNQQQAPEKEPAQGQSQPGRTYENPNEDQQANPGSGPQR